MSVREVSDEKGRKYMAHVDDSVPPGGYIVIGPPEGLVDELGLPEPVATRLHNILFDRKIYKFQDLSRNGVAFAVMQELYSVDTQKLAEAFAKFEKEEMVGG